MIVPDTINLNIYKYIFTFAIQSDTDGTLTYGSFKNSDLPVDKLRRLNSNDNKELSSFNSLEFFINVTEHP